MKTNNKISKLFNVVIQILASQNQACPEFLGKQASFKDADILSKKVFYFAVVNDIEVVRVNKKKLSIIIDSASLKKGLVINNDEREKLISSLLNFIGSEYVEYIKQHYRAMDEDQKMRVGERSTYH